MGMSKTFQVTFDAADPAVLAAFWARALGYVLQPPPKGFSSWEDFAEEQGIPPEQRNDLAAVVDPLGDRPRLLFQRVPEGKIVKNRVHLDVNAGGDVTAEPGERRRRVEEHVTDLVEAGGTRLETFDRNNEFWIVMQDPEGNEFCVQ
jgi:hypothetical protein